MKNMENKTMDNEMENGTFGKNSVLSFHFQQNSFQTEQFYIENEMENGTKVHFIFHFIFQYFFHS